MWDLKVIDTSRPLYLAIAEALERDVHAGVVKPGDMLPTHRALAKIVGVTVSTITRAYSVAEKRGLITAIVGKGTFVTADACTRSSVLDMDLEQLPMEMGLTKPLYMEDSGFRDVVLQVLEEGKLHKYMQYSDPQGLVEHREVGAAWLGRFGVPAKRENILITAGGQHALFSTLYSLFQPGDRIAVDVLTYPGVKAAARRLGLRLEGVIMDSEGIVPDELESLCNRSDIKGLYAVGRLQNPTNRIMSNKRRDALARIIRKYRLILVENDVYGFLNRQADRTLAARASANSVYIASLSKAFYAGLRIAFVAAPARLYNRIAQGVMDNMLFASPFCAGIACRSIQCGVADAIIERKIDELTQRVCIFREKLGHHRHTCSEQSMAAWLKLPDNWTGNQFETAAAQKGIRVYAAERFAVGPVVPQNYIRVSLSGAPDMQSFDHGLDTLVTLLDNKKAAAGGLF